MNEQIKYYFIVNKWAGARHSAQTWEKLHQLLLQNEVQFERVVTEYPQHATKLACEFANQHPKGWVIVAIGGDGTLLEVLNGVQRAENVVPIGYIPAGSGNDFARAVGIAFDPYAALQQLIQATAPVTLDIGAYQDQSDHLTRYFTNNIGIGFDASVVYEANQGQKIKLSKWHLESMAYASALFKTLHRQKGFPLTITIDGEQHQFDQAFVVSLTNIKYFGGGIGIAPLAKLDDGKLDVVITEKMGIFHFIKLFAKLLRGGKHLAMPDVFFKTGREIHVQSFDNEHGQVNGEDLPLQAFDLKIWMTKQDFWFKNK
jgi:YegS/Rv2252/BmrU family lipid kinase